MVLKCLQFSQTAKISFILHIEVMIVPKKRPFVKKGVICGEIMCFYGFQVRSGMLFLTFRYRATVKR